MPGNDKRQLPFRNLLKTTKKSFQNRGCTLSLKFEVVQDCGGKRGVHYAKLAAMLLRMCHDNPLTRHLVQPDVDHRRLGRRLAVHVRVVLQSGSSYDFVDAILQLLLNMCLQATLMQKRPPESILLVLTVLILRSRCCSRPCSQLHLGASDCAPPLGSTCLMALDICLDLLPPAPLSTHAKGMHSRNFATQAGAD